MSNKNPDEKINELVEKGAIIADIYFDLHGKSADEIKTLSTGLSKDISKEEGILYSTFEIEKPINENGVYSTYIEGRVLAKDFLSLVKIMLKYSPIGVEIVKPHTININAGDAVDILLEIAKHSYDYKFYIYTKLSSEKEKKRIMQSYENRKKLGEELLKKVRNNEKG